MLMRRPGWTVTIRVVRNTTPSLLTQASMPPCVTVTWDDSLSQDAVLYTKGRKNISPELIMKAWVEQEYYDPTLPFSNYQGEDRGHMTQCLWRPSSYVGCAQVAGPDTGDDACIIYGCRYAKAGNCDMQPFSSQGTCDVGASCYARR
jgi:hypothetical protein